MLIITIITPLIVNNTITTVNNNTTVTVIIRIVVIILIIAVILVPIITVLIPTGHSRCRSPSLPSPRAGPVIAPHEPRRTVPAEPPLAPAAAPAGLPAGPAAPVGFLPRGSARPRETGTRADGPRGRLRAPELEPRLPRRARRCARGRAGPGWGQAGPGEGQDRAGAGLPPSGRGGERVAPPEPSGHGALTFLDAGVERPPGLALAVLEQRLPDRLWGQSGHTSGPAGASTAPHPPGPGPRQETRPGKRKSAFRRGPGQAPGGAGSGRGARGGGAGGAGRSAEHRYLAGTC